MYESQLVLNLVTDEGLEPETDELGEVFTRPWVVDLILDLVGYLPERDLGAQVALEPACGAGAFLGSMVDRLIMSARKHHRKPADLDGALNAVDLSELNVERARKLTIARLLGAGIDMRTAEKLAKAWIRRTDFLLDADIPGVDYVVGNPPYIRLENVPAERTAAYRRNCPTMRGRSDVYIGFIERGLGVLNVDGALGFIVADRWMHNQYGAALRQLICDRFAVEAVIEMHEVDAFENDVSAYPAVTVIRRSQQGSAVLASTDTTFGRESVEDLQHWVHNDGSNLAVKPGFRAARLSTWFPGDELWPSGDPERLSVLSELESRFPPLEDPSTGTRVGIGVATGADSVYITEDLSCVENDRLLPLVMSDDIGAGQIAWSGAFLVNPWDEGKLVELDDYPRLASYLRDKEDILRARHVAQRQQRRWYRTIDRVSPDLLTRPKLLLPDIKASSHPVLDEGNYYPHHNLYFVTSDHWDLEVLGGLLLSDVANLFVGSYCVKMRGGCYRFQAQYLRRIRVPSPDRIAKGDMTALAAAFGARDVEKATSVAMKVYGLKSLPSRR